MACYRLYFIEAFYGRIDRFIQFEVDDDEAAIDFAKDWQGPLTLDLCNGVRPVKHWDPAVSAGRTVPVRNKNEVSQGSVRGSQL